MPAGAGVSGATTPAAGRTKSLGKLDKDEWYAVDVDCSGPEKRKWAGVEYESRGGKEVGRMVKGLWDERGWECLWVSSEMGSGPLLYLVTMCDLVCGGKMN